MLEDGHYKFEWPKHVAIEFGNERTFLKENFREKRTLINLTNLFEELLEPIDDTKVN